MSQRAFFFPPIMAFQMEREKDKNMAELRQVLYGAIGWMVSSTPGRDEVIDGETFER